MQVVNERSTAYLTVCFYDKAGVLATPTRVTYRIDDVTTGQAVRGDTTLGVANTIEITLTPADSAILNTYGVDELHRVTVIAVYGSSDQLTDEYIYTVKNLAKIT